MKFKISLDPNAMKQFCIDHGEKFLFGIVIVLFLLFVYRAVARDKLPWQPQDLAQDADLAKKKIEASKAEPPKIEEYTRKADRIRQPISEADYTFKTVWDPLIFPENRRRGLPEVVPVKDLRGAAGNGAFAMVAPEEEEEETEELTSTRGQRWVVLTGLIPHRKFKENYDAAYQEAAQWDPQRDYPDYYFYRVERAEVDPRIQTSELKWTPIHVRNMLGLQDFWLQPGGELVDPAHLVPPRDVVSMAYPLGPLQHRVWGPEVAHLPEILLLEPGSPLMSGGGMAGVYGTGSGKKGAAGSKGGKADAADEESEEQAAKRIEAEKKAAAERRKKARQRLAQQPDEPDTFLAGAAGGDASGGAMPAVSGRAYGGRGASRGMMPGAMPGAMPGMGSSAMGSMMSGMRGSGRRRATTGEEEQQAEEELEVEYKLFRFFDFSVAPGKHYLYRVKLVLVNPNYGMSPHFLEKEGMDKQKALETDWSDPSPPISVPIDSQVLVVSAKASHDTASLMLVRFDEKDGVTASEELATVQRGQFLNYRDREFTATTTTPTGMMGGMMGGMSDGAMGMPGMPGGGNPLRRPEEASEERKVNYITDALLLDVAGGGRLPGKDRTLVEPGSILLLDNEGKLVVRDELDDLPEYRFHKPPERQEVAGMPMMDEGSDEGPKSRRRGARGAASSSDEIGGYMDPMIGAGRRPKGGKGGKGAAGMPPGMTPGMMPGMMSGSSGMDMGALDDKAGSKRKKKSR